jgi:predicted RNA methylase
LVAVSQRLSDALMALDPAGRTVLELGCGRGSLLLGLKAASRTPQAWTCLGEHRCGRRQFGLASL